MDGMRQGSGQRSILAGYRVLDLASERGLLCGMLLGDLGADVIKIERPGGDPARAIGPFYHDEADREKGLYWLAYNRNKRGITLDIETADGRELFKRLVKTADFVIETFPPGYMAKLGLGYADLETINPRIIVVSITDWGQDGPYVEQGWQADDMVLWALGGPQWLDGQDMEHPPVQVSFPQAYLNAGAEAATAAVTAHCYRERTGEGQHVDIGAIECLPYMSDQAMSAWEIEGVLYRRGSMKAGIRRPDGTVAPIPTIWQCKDGYVLCMMGGGALISLALSSTALTRWMAAEGMDEGLREINWHEQDFMTVDLAILEREVEIIARFLLTKTKEEIYQRAIRDKIMAAPVSDPADVAANPQLQSRQFFVDISHPELGKTLSYCGPFARFSRTPIDHFSRAPLIGEHNVDIYRNELGLSPQQLETLMREGTL